MSRSWVTFLLGSRLADREEREEQIGPLRGVGILGLDALASAAYGPEALLTVLIVLGTASARWVLPLSAIIVVVLAIVSLSYRQTIGAYPGGGGSYTVARENLSQKAGLVAAASLSLDYILNVAVAIAAGVGALVSAIPGLLPWTVWLCLALLLLITLVNLRGLRSSGAALVAPTYIFVVCLLAVIVVGIVRAIVSGGAPVRDVAPTELTPVEAPLTWWLLLRAFANGCTAMTGIEAVSNGVPFFRPPSVVGARRTLLAITVILITLLLGVALLCRLYDVTATEPGAPGYRSVLSQLAAAVFGHGVLYGIIIASIIAVLILSANTSFAGLPFLYRILAGDRYLPETFMHRGRRLVFSHGIIALAVTSGVLLVVFQGITNRLIPLFAVGALASFTLSQAGMVVHWKRRPTERLARARLAMNATGAVATGVTLTVIIVAKFTEGAWISLLVVAALYGTFLGLHRYYERLDRGSALHGPLDLHPLAPPQVLVPIRRWDHAAERALRFAVTLSPEVRVIQVLTSDRLEDDLTERWADLIERPAADAGVPPPQLVVLPSEFRELYRPILDYVRSVEDIDPHREVAVIVPQIVRPRWYHVFLHNNTAALLKAFLTMRGGPRVVVISAPWHLGDAEERALATRPTRWSRFVTPARS